MLFAAPAAAGSYTVITSGDLNQAIADDATNTGGATEITIPGSVTVQDTPISGGSGPFVLNIDTTPDNAILFMDGPTTVWDMGSYHQLNIDGSTGGGVYITGGADLVIHDNPDDANDANAFLNLGSGTLYVDGVGTTLTTNYLSAGRTADSNVTITGGAHVTTSTATMGEAPPAAPGANTNATNITVLVDGAGTVWDAGYFAAGGASDTVEVTLSGGAVINAGTNSSIGRNGNASMEVTGAGSRFVVDGDLHVGERMPWVDATSFPGLGDGTLTISDGGVVSATSVALALTGTNDHDAGISGDLVVDPDGTLETGELWQGYGTGTATFRNGTLRATGNSASLIHGFDPGNFVLDDAGMFLDSNGFNVLAESAMSGDGDLTKLGQGGLYVLGANVYEGVTYVNEGGLYAGTTNTFSANSDHRVAAGAVLHLLGYDQTVQSLYNAGTVGLGAGTSGTILTVDEDYVGAGGVIDINTVLGNDMSSTDRVVVEGDSTGNSSIFVFNLGGTGDQTVEGIRIVEVTGASTGHFDLIGDYVFEGEQAVVGGAYAYRLYQGGTSTPDDGDWYLRSTLIPTDNGPGDPGDPVYQAGVPLYEAYPRALQALNQLSTLQQRVGNRSWAGEASTVGVVDLGDPQVEATGIWARIEGARGHEALDTTSGGTTSNANLWRLQAGVDGVINQSAGGVMIGGAYLDYGLQGTDVASFFGDGSISTMGFGGGGTLTWYDASGFYLDGVAQLHWFDSTLSSSTAGLDVVKDNAGFGVAFSLEAGRQIAIGDQWSVTPQAQLVYNNVGFTRFADAFGADVGLGDGGGFTGRLGLSVDYDDAAPADAALSRTHLYGIANLYYAFDASTGIVVAENPLTASADALYGGLGLGGSYNWADDRYSLYGEASFRTGLDDPGANYSLNGTLGLRGKW